MKTPAAVDSQTLSARLVSNRRVVLELWEMRVRREVPAARDQSRLSLHDDIPDFLDALALALDGAPPKGEVREVADACEKHGEERSRNARYTLAQALKEFEILHDVLVEALAAGEPLDFSAHAIVRKAVHEGMQAAAVAFSDAKRNEFLSDERDFLNDVLDNLSEGVVACDSRGVITLFNKATREFHGLPESAVPAERWAEHYSLFREGGVTPLPPNEIPLYRALRGEAIRDVEMVIAPVNGKPRTLLASARVLKDPQGATTGAVVAMHDVSVYRAAEETRAALAAVKAERDAAEKSEAATASILESISDAFCALDSRWQFTYLNGQAEKILRRSRSDLIGKELWREFPAVVGSDLDVELRRAAREQRVVDFETENGPFEGWLHVKAYPSPTGLSVYFEDVTESRRAREAIRESEQRFRTLADSMPQLVWTATPSGALDYVNRGFLEFTGLCEKDAIHWETGTYLHPGDFDRVSQQWSAALASGQPYQCEVRFLRADGEFRWHLSRAVPAWDASGQLVKWYGSSTDVHDSKNLLVELEIAKNKAEYASKVKSAFLANMSHEIRTPLGAILGYAEILQAPQHSASDRSKWTGAILRNAQQLSLLIDEVLDLAKVEAERLEIEPLRFELAEVLREVELVSGVLARDKAIDLRFESEAPARAKLVSDPTRLRQILVNVVGNAIKFTERGHVVVRVSLTRSAVEKERMLLTISVEDTGIGLCAEQAERIWEPFVQADNSMTRQFGGTGLGLSLSRQLARVLGGDLFLTRSEIGKGSVFTVSIDGGPQEDLLIQSLLGM